METIPDIIRGFRATDGEVLRIAGVEAEPFAAVDPRHMRIRPVLRPFDPEHFALRRAEITDYIEYRRHSL